MFVAIHKIKLYTKTFQDGEDLRYSSLHWDATIRELELIGEALNTLLNDEKFLKSAPPYFRKVVNFRNAISHGYFGIDESEVWNIVDEKLDLLSNDLHQICKDNIDLSKAIQSQIVDYSKLKDNYIMDYLRTLK